MRTARCAVWTTLLGVAVVGMDSAPLRAQPAQPAASATAEADAEYARVVGAALAEFEQGRWDEARSWFERAHELRPNARTLWGLGITSFELGHYARALRELELAMRDGRLPLEGPQRAQAREVIARAARHVGVLSIELEPERAALSLDGAQTADRELVLSPGSYVLAARAEGFHERELRVEVAPGEKRLLRIALRPVALQVRASAMPAGAAAAQAPPPAARDAAEADDDGSVLEQWWLWTAVTVVIAGGVTAFLVLDGDDSEPKVDARVDVLTRQP